MINFLVIFFIFCSTTVYANEWLKYAVVLKGTGSNVQDKIQLEKYRLQLAKIALSYKGTPYIFGGTSHKGMDCSGFMMIVYKSIGVNIPRISFDQGKAGAPIKKNLSSLRTGDLIYFKQDRKGYPHHVGMYLWNGWFIHCSTGKGVNVESFYKSKLTHAVKYISRIIFTEYEGKILTRLRG